MTGARFTIGEWLHWPPLFNLCDATLGLVQMPREAMRVVAITHNTITMAPVKRRGEWWR